MWGGRFLASPAAIMEEINASIDFDKRLWRHDILASKAHAAMLADAGIITKKEGEEIARGLDKIAAEIEAGKFNFARALEDIHLNVESRLAELIGPVAGKLHTARSRNDQVATDLRLYMRDEIDSIDALLARLQLVLAEKALAHAATVMPGFTHLQTAQPITFGHHLLAYAEMFGRDRGRFADARAGSTNCRWVLRRSPARASPSIATLRRRRSALRERRPIRSTRCQIATSRLRAWLPRPSPPFISRVLPKRS